MRVEEPGGPDAVTVDNDHPVYQVNVFRPVDYPSYVPEHMRVYRVHEWGLHDAEVAGVLAWAKATAGSDPYTVMVASVAIHGESHLLRLCGTDPNRGELTEGRYAAPPDGVIPNIRWFVERAQREQGQAPHGNDFLAPNSN